ncbi:MAG: transcription elongation factor GreAB [Pseudomonadales bacterium]|nr:transcription elongation factor GreAB [Pseudomonadales bacterium]
MFKTDLILAIIEQLHQQLDSAMSALKMAADTATHKETVAESKYDTFGLEASYLAHGQQQRVAETQLSIQSFQQLLKTTKKQAAETVEIASLVLLQEEDKSPATQKWFFIANSAGGLKLEFNAKTITVISQDAPLTAKLLGKEIDDDIVLADKHYFISQLL